MSLIWQPSTEEVTVTLNSFDKNGNQRWHEEHDESGVGFFCGTINCLVISALIYVPIFIYFWRTK